MKPSKKAKNRGASKASKSSLSRIPMRLNILIGIVVLMLGILGAKAYKMQILDHNTYESTVTRGTTSTKETTVQRGLIYDSTGKVLVSNKGVQAITYTKPSSITEADMYAVANKVSRHVTISTAQLSDTNYATYYNLSPKRAAKVAKKAGITLVAGTDAYAAAVKKYVADHKANFPLSKRQINAAMIYQKMNNAYSLSTIYIKQSGVTKKEIAAIGERQTSMPGVAVGMYYKRSYPKGSSIKSLVGTVSTLPDSSLNKLLAQGYSRDDLTGTSYLEKEYESVLKGTKKKSSVTTSASGTTKTKTIYNGEAGSSLKLTINNKFQQAVRKVLKDNMPDDLTTGMYAVVMNPKTGGIYSMVGIDRDNKTGKLTNNDLSNVLSAQIVGSVVKPATITTAMMQGIITPTNNTLTDQPIKIAGTATKATDWNTDGSANTPLTASEALEMSSNSYVMQLALKMGGLSYHSGMTLRGFDSNIFTTMRRGYARFGLGVKTGIDIPGEASGLKGATTASSLGSAVDEAYGQYDTYTNIQLAQYVSAIANGGTRIQPHIVESIRSHTGNKKSSSLLTTIPTKVLGSIGWTKEERNVIWHGMYMVTHGTSSHATGTGLKDTDPVVYAKTGTAETTTNGQSTFTRSMIAFVKDSDVAVSLVIPGYSSYKEAINVTVTKQIFEKFWEIVQDSGSNTTSQTGEDTPVSQ